MILFQWELKMPQNFAQVEFQSAGSKVGFRGMNYFLKLQFGEDKFVFFDVLKYKYGWQTKKIWTSPRTCGAFLKWGVPPVIMHFRRIFRYKPSSYRGTTSLGLPLCRGIRLPFCPGAGSRWGVGFPAYPFTTLLIRGYLNNGWCISWKILLKWMIWVYPHFRKSPYENY